VAAEGLLLSSACPVKRLGEWDMVAGVDPDDSDLVSGGGGGELPEVTRNSHNNTGVNEGATWQVYDPGYSMTPMCEVPAFARHQGSLIW
jgi:hypothetical protein